MMDRTDRHCRYLLRRLSAHVRLYTEMVTTGALLHGDRERFLAHHSSEHPVALQLGGNDPRLLAQCAYIVEQAGYDEVNLNAGCPSDRVQAARFGACLMAEPIVVADCVKAMQDRVRIPVTVKTRLGIDEKDSYAELANFIATVSAAGCEVFILHARKAWLQGLSPRENRAVPPLRYDIVYRIKQDFPHLNIVINGGIKSTQEVTQHLQHCDGVMIGRQVYDNPLLLVDIEQQLFGTRTGRLDPATIVESLYPYIQSELDAGTYLKHMTRHLFGLYKGRPGARLWRRILSEHASRPEADIGVLRTALAAAESASRPQPQQQDTAPDTVHS